MPVSNKGDPAESERISSLLRRDFHSGHGSVAGFPQRLIDTTGATLVGHGIDALGFACNRRVRTQHEFLIGSARIAPLASRSKTSDGVCLLRFVSLRKSAAMASGAI
jgi:hypothetical protein